MTGAEYKKFFADDVFWPKDSWCDDEIVTIDGVEVADVDTASLVDTAKITLDGGVVMDRHGEVIDELARFFKKWQKGQTHVTCSVELPKDQLEHFKQLVANSPGWRVL